MGRLELNRGNKCTLPPIEREEILALSDGQRAAWSITAFNLPKAWSATQGEGIKIAVLDTGCDLTHPDLAANLLPGINFVQPGKPPEDDNQHGCVHPDTLLHTSFCGVERASKLYNRIDVSEQVQMHSDGYVSGIKDVSSLGIKTISLSPTGKTEICFVTHLHKMPVNTDLVEINLEGQTKLQLTPWHPVYVYEKTSGNRRKLRTKRADELIVGDNLVCPQKTDNWICNDYYRTKIDHWRCENCGHCPKTKNPHDKCKKCGKVEWRKDEILVTENLSYLIGMILTDGHICKDETQYRIEITNNCTDILLGCQKRFESLGYKSKMGNQVGKCPRLIVNSAKLVKTLLALGLKRGNKTYSVRLPEFVGKSPISVIDAFIAGVVDGDGCISPSNTQNRVTTVSAEFAEYMTALMNSRGINARQSVKKNYYRGKLNVLVPLRRITHGRIPSSIAEFMLHPMKRARILANNKCKDRTVRRVKTITRNTFNGDFYDMTVEKNHTYVANGCFLSNTHVTGIICAINNDFGVVGVAPKANVMPVKILDKNGSGNFDNVARGIKWAVENGADIISMSLGSPMPLPKVQMACQWADSQGVPVFCAAGNCGHTKELLYPANYPETISIGSIDENFNRSGFSNTGNNLDFLAPGGKIFSTVPKNWYAILSGTSMACPFAVGVAALLLSYKRQNNLSLPLRSAQDYRNLFKEHVVPVSDPNFAGKKFFQGFGIIDPRTFYRWLESN